MSYQIYDEKIPVGWLKVFEIGIDPTIESLFRKTKGHGGIIRDYMSRCGEEFNHRNRHIEHVLVALERNPS